MADAVALRCFQIRHPRATAEPLSLELRVLTRLEGRRPDFGRFILRGSQVLAPQDDGLANVAPHSRDAIRPSFARNFPPSQFRGRRECRMRAAPAWFETALRASSP